MCESKLNCSSDTRQRVNISWQTAFSSTNSSNCDAWALQKWHLYRHIRTKRFTPAKTQLKRFTGSQMYTVWMFPRLGKYLCLLWIEAYAPKALYEQVQDIQNVCWKLLGVGWKRNNSCLPDSRNSTVALASLSDLHHFHVKFHQFSLQLPKLTVLVWA